MVRAILLVLLLFLLVAPVSAQPVSPADIEHRAIERRAVEAAIWGIPVVNYDLMLQEALRVGARVNEIVYWGRPLDWHNQTLTPNPDAIYLMAFFNTKDVGPVVIEVPSADGGGSLNGNIVNVWQMALEDAGPTGADQGRGGKYLVLPPGYAEQVPEGYIPLRSDTYGGYALLRSNLRSHAEADIAASVAYGKRVKMYPLSQAANPPATRFTDAQNALFDSTIRYDASFFQNLDRVIQAEPWLDRDRAMIDPLRTLGIEKGKIFNPNPVTKAALGEGIHEAELWLKAKYDAGLPPYWEGSRWTYVGFPELIKAAQAGYTDPDDYPIDARGIAYSYAFVGLKRLGTGQFYVISIRDKDGNPFSGGSTYRLTVPPDVPVAQYWSVTAYDRETHALIRNMPRASRSSQIADLQKNADGSVDLYFGPKAPEGKDANWVPTDPSRGLELMFRLYGPTKPLFDKTWKLPDVEKTADTSPKSPQAAAVSTAAMPADEAREENAYAVGLQAYLWGYPLRYYALSSPRAVSVGGAFVNDFRKYPELKTARDRFVVTPNNVTIDAYAELDLTAEPVVLVVPPLAEPRWYIVQIGDSFDEIIRDLGGTDGPQPGVYIVTGPDFAGAVPGAMTQIRSRTKIGVAAVRILANGAADLPHAVEAQKGFRLMPLSAYLRQGLAYVPPEPRPQMVAYDGQAPAELRAFDELGFAMSRRLPISADSNDSLVASFRQIGLSVGNGFAWQGLDGPTRRGLARAISAGDKIIDAKWAAAGETVNGWKYTFAGGRAGYDPGLRAALAKYELGAQLSDQVLYPNTSVDDKGAPLTGERNYALHFDAGQLPPVSVFWNMSMYGSDMLFVENGFRRYSIGSTTEGLRKDADGSLTILIQKDRPADTSNWLPAPAGPFNLTMRLYGPQTSVLDGSYRLPSVRRDE